MWMAVETINIDTIIIQIMDNSQWDGEMYDLIVIKTRLKKIYFKGYSLRISSILVSLRRSHY